MRFKRETWENKFVICWFSSHVAQLNFLWSSRRDTRSKVGLSRLNRDVWSPYFTWLTDQELEQSMIPKFYCYRSQLLSSNMLPGHSCEKRFIQWHIWHILCLKLQQNHHPFMGRFCWQVGIQYLPIILLTEFIKNKIVVNFLYPDQNAYFSSCSAHEYDGVD